MSEEGWRNSAFERRRRDQRFLQRCWYGEKVAGVVAEAMELTLGPFCYCPGASLQDSRAVFAPVANIEPLQFYVSS